MQGNGRAVQGHCKEVSTPSCLQEGTWESDLKKKEQIK